VNSADLIELVAGDLPGYRLDRRARGLAVFVPESGGLPLEVTERLERRFLGRTRVAVFGASFPSSGWPDGILRLRHAGGFRRTGVSLEADEEHSTLADLLQSDQAFVTTTTTLDFKRFEIEVREGRSRVTVELEGASLVAIALPPIRSYVRLYPDQRQALVAGFEALRRLVSVSPADRRY
jgi:hypothetical protein